MLGTALHRAFHVEGARSYRALNSFIWSAIALSIALMIVEPFFPEWSSALATLDWAFLVLFAVEVCLRILSYRPPTLTVLSLTGRQRIHTEIWGRFAYALTPLILFDIAAVLALVPALRGLRALRLLRLLRTIKIFRYKNPFEGIFAAFKSDKLLFMFALGFLASEILLGGICFYFIERGNQPDLSLLDSFWWAIVTITTVGFGDITPYTVVGRTLASFLMVGGMFTLALFAGIVGHSLLGVVLGIREEQFRMSGYSDHIIVCGFEKGNEILLEALEKEVQDHPREIVIFSPHERPPTVPVDFMWVEGEPTRETELDKVRVAYAHAVIIAAERSVPPQHADATTILATFTLRSYLSKHSLTKNRRRPLHIVCEILDSENARHAFRAGADEVIETSAVGASLLGHSVMHPGLSGATSGMLLFGEHNLYAGNVPAEIQLPATFGPVMNELKTTYGVLSYGVLQDENEHIINPPHDFELKEGMRILYLARKEVLPIAT